MTGSHPTTESISARPTRIFIYTSAFSTDPGRNSGFLPEIHTRGYEKPSYWNFTTVSYARGVYLELVMVIFIFNSALINCLMQQTEMSAVMNSLMENQAELMKEVKSLRKENQQLRQMLWWVWIHFCLSCIVGSFDFQELTIDVCLLSSWLRLSF